MDLLLDDLVDGGQTLRDVVGIQQLLVGSLEKAIAAIKQSDQIGPAIRRFDTKKGTSRCGVSASRVLCSAFCLQLIEKHLPGAGLCKDEKRHDGSFGCVHQPRFAFVDGSVEGGSLRLSFALFLEDFKQKKSWVKNNFLPPVLEFRWGKLGPSSTGSSRGQARKVRTAERVLADSQACAAAAVLVWSPLSNPGIQQRRPEPHQHSSSSNKQTGCHLKPSQRNRQRKMEGLLFNVNNGYVVHFGVIYLCATSETHRLTCWGSPSAPLQLHRGHRPRLSQRTAHRHQLHQHDTMREHRW